MTRQEVTAAANNILKAMGGNAQEICCGNCPDFAKSLVDLCGGQIVSNLSDDMLSELDGYDVIKPEAALPKPTARNNWESSHCWVKTGNRFYDAHNPEGVDTEEDLAFFEYF